MDNFLTFENLNETVSNKILSLPVAVIGKNRNKKIVYLNEVTNEKDIIKIKKIYKPTETDFENMIEKMKSLKLSKHITGKSGYKNFMLIKNFLIKNISPPIEFLSFYKEAKYALDECYLKKIIDEECNCEIIPSVSPKRDVIYIAGRSGSGKSYRIAHYAKNYSRVNPENRIYVISRIKDDPAFEIFKHSRIEPDDIANISDEDEFSTEDFKNSLIIFDDIGTLTGKKLTSVTNLIDNILNCGRHYSTSIIVSSHLLTDYSKTRNILNEATILTFFPQGCSRKSLNYTLESYLGLEKEKIKEILRVKSRHITIKKTFPTVFLYAGGIWII